MYKVIVYNYKAERFKPITIFLKTVGKTVNALVNKLRAA